MIEERWVRGLSRAGLGRRLILVTLRPEQRAAEIRRRPDEVE